METGVRAQVKRALFHERSIIKRILIYNLSLVSIIVLASRLITAIHEILGHGAAAVAYGFRVSVIHISLFGGGKVVSNFNHPEPWANFIYGMAGIIVNIVAGGLCIILIRKTKKPNNTRHLFWILFATMSLVGALAYQITGAYYGYGDPAGWAGFLPNSHPVFWAPFLALSPFVTYYCTKQYLSVQEIFFPVRSFGRRLSISAATLGAAVCAYIALFVIANQTTAFLRAPDYAYNKARLRVIEQKRADLFKKLQEQYPDLTSEEILNKAIGTEIKVDRDEIPERFPILHILIALNIAGGLAAVRFAGAGQSDQAVNQNTGEVVYITMTAMVVLAFLASVNGFVYVNI